MPHLLIVDDDDLFRESLGLNLVDEGYEVTSFANGQDALSYLDRGSADVMLLDWRMPTPQGSTCCAGCAASVSPFQLSF